jgi:hypothetical membrane protein
VTEPGPLMTRQVRLWALLSAPLAPLALIGGWTLAAARQPRGYSSVRETISALAGHAATDRWIMTTGLALLGLCHLLTATGLRAARTPGRLFLGLGGLATVLVASFPLPAHGTSRTHGECAIVAFVGLAVWPVFAATGRGVLRPRVAGTACAVLVMLLGWFALALGTRLAGLSERMLAGAEALWPLVVVSLCLGRAADPSRISA